MTLVSGDNIKYRVSRAVLACASGFFSNMFKDLPEAKEYPVAESGETLSLGLSQILGCSVSTPSLTMANVGSLLDFCIKYDVPKGLSACDAFLSAPFKFSPELFTRADQFDLPRYREMCMGHAVETLMAYEEMKPGFYSCSPPRAGNGPKWLDQLKQPTLSELVRARASALPDVPNYADAAALRIRPCY